MLINLRRFLCGCFLIFWQTVLFSQNGELLIETGGNAVFHINSIKKYNDGQSLDNWTRLSISISGLGAADGWRVEVLAEDPTLDGDNWGRNLDVDYLSVSASANNPASGALNYFPVNAVGVGPQNLITGTGNGLFIVNVSYGLGLDLLGTDNILLGEWPDYYTVRLFFDLKPN
jgi:hypothetical protein